MARPGTGLGRSEGAYGCVLGGRLLAKSGVQYPGNLFGFEEKQGNDAVAGAFKERLKDIAGFKHVLDPMPMRNTRGAIVYYLFFASQKPVAEKIVNDIFKKYRHHGVANGHPNNH
jgi:hypothetical protein